MDEAMIFGASNSRMACSRSLESDACDPQQQARRLIASQDARLPPVVRCRYYLRFGLSAFSMAADLDFDAKDNLRRAK